jgi:hypothetical protein
MTLAVLLFLFGCVNLIYPIRTLGISRRLHGALMIGGSVAVAMMFSLVIDPKAATKAATVRQSTVPEVKRTATRPAYESSGQCRTDSFGARRCDSETKVGSWTASSQSTCGRHPVTGRYECKWESSAR